MTQQAPPKTKADNTVVVVPKATESIALPKEPEGLVPLYVPNLSDSPSIASLQYFGPKAKGDRVDACKDAGIPYHEFYLKDSIGVMKLSPARIFPIANQFKAYVQLDDEMNVLAAKDWQREKPGDSNGMRWTEVIMGAVLVPNDDDTTLYPVVFTTHGAQGHLWKAIAEAQTQVSGKGAVFAARGVPHKESVKCKHETGRFVARIWGREEVAQGTKMKYNKGLSSIIPTNAKQHELVERFIDSGRALGLLAVYDRRVADLKNTITKTGA